MLKANCLVKLLLLFFMLLIVTFIAVNPSSTVQAQSSEESSTVAELKGSPIAFKEYSNKLWLNFTMFIMEFYKSGYEMLYAKNGSVLVYYHSMVLQYYNPTNKKWVQCGTFTSLSWTKVDDWHYQVVKHYQDSSTSPKTNYTVTYDIRSDSRVKITINIESGADRQYRLQWSLDGIVYSDWTEKKSVDNVKHQLLFGDENRDYSFIKIDWQDVYEQFKADISTYSVSTSAQGRKTDVYFTFPNVVKTGEALTVDPSLVGTITAGGIRDSFQRKSFYAYGKFWLFYSDGTNMVYKTSDGSTWSSATTIRSAASGNSFSVWFDGTYVHYAYADSSQIYYRRGTPNADGTITWSASEQTVSTTYNAAQYPMVAVDSNRYVWIGYIDNNYPFVIKSGRNDGTWGTTPTGFPHQLASTTAGRRVSVVPLTAGKMLVIYPASSNPVKAKAWTGSAWTAESSTTAAISNHRYYSAVAQANYVHLVFMQYGNNIVYTKYNYSSNSWSAETTLQTGVADDSAPVISINPSTNDLYVFYAGYPEANHIYYCKYIASTATWVNGVDWIAENETLAGNDCLTCFYQAYGSKIGLAYMTQSRGPYNVKFDFLSVSSSTIPPNAPTLNNPPADHRFNPSASVTFTWTFNDPESGDSQLAYQLQIAADSAFTNIILDTGRVTSTSSSVTKTLPSTVGLYFWRVKTWDSGFLEGPWSNSSTLIVDKINVFYVTVSDSYVNVGETVVLRVKAKLEYDDHMLGSGDSLSTSVGTLTWDSSSETFKLEYASDTVKKVTWTIISGYEATYNITAVTMSVEAPSTIWDRIKVLSFTLPRGNTTISTQQLPVRVNLIFEYSGNPVTSGTVSIQGFSANSLGGGVWEALISSSPGTLVVNTVTAASNGIHVVNMNEQSVTLRFYLYYYNLTFNPLRREETGELLGAAEYWIIFEGNSWETIVVNRTVNREYADKLILYVMVNKTRQYWMPRVASNYTFSPVLPNVLSAYTVSFIDYTGLLTRYRLAEIQTVVNGSRVTVERRLLDNEQKCVFYVSPGKMYTVVFMNLDNAFDTCIYGDVTFTGDLTLRVKDVYIPPNVGLVWRDVQINIVRKNETIEVNYLDKLGMTISVHIQVKFYNGTLATEVVYMQNSFVYTFVGNASLGYIVNVQAEHLRYGRNTIVQCKVFPPMPEITYWNLDWLGNWQGLDNSALIPAVLVVFAASAATVLSATVGAFLAVALTACFSYMGWLPVPSSILVVAFAFTILMGISYAKRRIIE